LKTRTGRLRGRWLVATGIGVALLGSKGAYAGDGGTVSSTTPTISPELAALRYQPGSDAGAPGHTGNYSPSSINYADCANGIDIAFTVDLANAPAGDEIQVWAGSGSADCTQQSARTASASTTPSDFPGRCWPVAANNVFDPKKSSATGRIHVRDLVAYIGQDNPPAAYSPTTDSSVCNPHATGGAVQLNIYFIFVPSGGTSTTASPVDGVSGLYQTVAALVGPFAPQTVTVPNTGITANTLTVYWVPQSESSILGYNIYRQDQGLTGTDNGIKVDASPTLETQVYCHEPVACTIPDAGDSTDAGGSNDAGGATDGEADAGTTDAGHGDATVARDATADATVTRDATLADAGGKSTTCDAGLGDALVPVDGAAYQGMSEAGIAAMGCEYGGSVSAQNPPTGGSGKCISGVLTSLFLDDGGLGSIETVASLDSGTIIDEGVDSGFDSGEDADLTTVTVDASTTVTSTPGTIPETSGISLIPSQYFTYYSAGPDTTSYTLTGLTTGHQYAIAVAAVDAYGNVGPIGNLGCSTPTPVNDFFMQYTNDGGRAGGGFCSLSAVGAPTYGSVFGFGIAGSAVAFARRRRRTRRAAS